MNAIVCRCVLCLSLTALVLAAQPCQAAEKAVMLTIPACNCAVANAVVVGLLEDVPGVRHARVNGMDSTATVFYDNATTSAEKIREALEKANIAVDGESTPSDAQGRCSIK